MENYEVKENETIITELSPGIFEIGNFDTQDCIVNDAELEQLYEPVQKFWEEDKIFNPQKTPFPMLMSEYTARVIQERAAKIESQLNPLPEEKPWNPNDDENLYNFSILLRVNVPDTIKPIADNTWDMLSQIEKRSSIESPDNKIFIRSFFTGSAVTEKELIHQLTVKNKKNWCIVTTDSKTMSTAYSALNLALLNSRLPEDQKFKIILTNHQIDEQLETFINRNDRTIIIQKGRAENCCKYSGDIEWDGLLLDNGLPYVSKENGDIIVEEILKYRNSQTGMAINILGLDSDILVDIPTSEKLKEIFSMRNLFKYYKSKFIQNSPINYPHKYEYVKDGDIYKINKVYSYGAALLFTLIRKNLSKLATISSLINNATGLSRAKSEVITSPVTTHYSILDLLKKNNIKYEEIMKALDPKAFGFEESISEDGERIFIKKAERTSYTTTEFYKECKNTDPLVLRTSRFWVD
jgi:hypothetical protein